MPNNLTDAEVKKALELCASEHLGCEDGCPLKGMNCRFEMPKLALDLINRLEGENEKNENIIRIADKTIATLNAENENLKAEVERLQNTIAIFTQNSVDFANEIKRQKEDKEDAFQFAADIVNAEKIVIAEAKTEAYKEFANRLTDKIMDNIDRSLDNPNGNNYIITDVYETIDNLLNELVGDGDGKRKD